MSYTRALAPCQYCKLPLKIAGGWKECTTCYVNFCPNTESGIHIKWEREVGEWYVALNLYPDIDKTVLVAHNKYHDFPELTDEKQTRIELPTCMRDITPENCVTKMKFLLLWQ